MRVALPLGPPGRHRVAIADDPVRVGPPQEGAIQLGELDPLHRPGARREDLAVGAEAKPLGGQLLTPMAQAGGEVLPRDPQLAAGAVPAPYQQMHVGVVGVVVIDRDPVQARAEVTLHVADELPGVHAQVQARGVLGRHHELPQPLVARALPGAQCGDEIDGVALRVEAEPPFALALGALARQVDPVRAPRAPAAIRRVGRLDDAALQPRRRAREHRDPARAWPAVADTCPAPRTACTERGLPPAPGRLDLEVEVLVARGYDDALRRGSIPGNSPPQREGRWPKR